MHLGGAFSSKWPLLGVSPCVKGAWVGLLQEGTWHTTHVPLKRYLGRSRDTSAPPPPPFFELGWQCWFAGFLEIWSFFATFSGKASWVLCNRLPVSCYLELLLSFQKAWIWDGLDANFEPLYMNFEPSYANFEPLLGLSWGPGTAFLLKFRSFWDFEGLERCFFVKILFKPIFDRFLSPTWAQLGPKLGPCWSILVTFWGKELHLIFKTVRSRFSLSFGGPWTLKK